MRATQGTSRSPARAGVEKRSPPGAGARPRQDDSPVLWQFGVEWALVAVPVAWLAIGLLLWGSHTLTGWPTAANSGALVIVVTLAGLTPIWLLLIDSLAARQATVTTQWLSIDFSKAANASGPRTVRLETGLGFVGQPINDSSVIMIQDTLDQAGGKNEVAILDLASGGGWWMTRLLALCAGAARNGAPKALVFVGDDGRGTAASGTTFLGWIEPTDGLRRLREQRPELKEIYDRSQAIARYLTILGPRSAPLEPPLPSLPKPPPPDWAPKAWAAQYAADPGGRFTDIGEDAFVRVLLDQLGQYEAERMLTVEKITAGTLIDLFAGLLHEDIIDIGLSAERQLEALLSSYGAYVAIVDRTGFQNVVHRADLQNGVLRGLVLPDNAAA